MRVLAALLLCLCVLTPGALFGQGYVEGFFGSTSIDVPSGFDIDDETAFGFWGGYAFSSNFAFEVGYGNYGEFEDSFIIDDGFDEFLVDVSSTVTSFNVGIKGIVPLEGGVFLHGKVGMAFWEDEVNTTFSDGFESFSASVSVDDEDMYFGFGASYMISYTAYATVDYLMVDVEDADVSVVSIGIGMLF